MVVVVVVVRDVGGRMIFVTKVYRRTKSNSMTTLQNEFRLTI